MPPDEASAATAKHHAPTLPRVYHLVFTGSADHEDLVAIGSPVPAICSFSSVAFFLMGGRRYIDILLDTRVCLLSSIQLLIVDHALTAAGLRIVINVDYSCDSTTANTRKPHLHVASIRLLRLCAAQISINCHQLL